MKLNLKLAGIRYFFSAFFLTNFFNCSPSYDEPVVALDDYKIEKGFTLESIASEPLIEAPVAIDFDLNGRIWVVEMRGYMQNIEGLNEEMPNGRIVILEDRDDDGVMDHTKVFLDSLVLPRALALVYGGLLYAEPPNLWFVEIENDLPVKKVLVDSSYADAGNVEHQPNGLLLNIDNWIYNAKSNFRYKKVENQWIKEPTTFRGQWGISQDNFGRLFYNHNSALLLGDFVLPNILINNRNFSPKAGVQNRVSKSQQIYPLHPTLVNRGYQKGVLDDDSILISATSACGPLIFRGHQFGDEYMENAFVCLPEGNLVKRLALTHQNNEIYAKPVLEENEFLAATDPGFRPVNLKTGPDGNMYIVDMHRGIIQHAAYMSSYLRKHLEEGELGEIIGMGRILRVKKQIEANGDVNIDWDQPVNLLTHPNGWVRDRAQHIIVYQHQYDKVEALSKMAKDTSHPLAQVHAIRTLEGLNSLSFELLKEIALKSNADVAIHSLIIINQITDQNHLSAIESLFEYMLQKRDPAIDLYIGHLLGKWAKLSPEFIYTKLAALNERYSDNKLIKEATISGLDGTEKDFLEFLNNRSNINDTLLTDGIKLSLANKKANNVNAIFTVESVNEDGRTKGLKLYRKICANCHGIDGAGIVDLAPPLQHSEYVDGPVKQLGLIILHGLKGPITVNGVNYKLNAVMPGLITNQEITNEDIASIIDYIKNAFTRNMSFVEPDLIEQLRKEKPKDGSLYTNEALKEWLKTNTENN